MMINRPLFPQDKNYILKEAQTDTKTKLLERLVEKVRETYLNRYNPLGLEDDTVKVIKQCKQFNLHYLDTFYWELAGIFRYRIGSNQLEFIFSGISHYEKYFDNWCEMFDRWAEDFLTSRYFIRAVLEMTILHSQERVALLAKDRLKVYLAQYFNLKVYRFRGIVPTAAA